MRIDDDQLFPVGDVETDGEKTSFQLKDPFGKRKGDVKIVYHGIIRPVTGKKGESAFHFSHGPVQGHRYEGRSVIGRECTGMKGKYPCQPFILIDVPGSSGPDIDLLQKDEINIRKTFHFL